MSVKSGADPGIKAVSPQVTLVIILGGRLSLFLPVHGLGLASYPRSITALWPVWDILLGDRGTFALMVAHGYIRNAMGESQTHDLSVQRPTHN